MKLHFAFIIAIVLALASVQSAQASHELSTNSVRNFCFSCACLCRMGFFRVIRSSSPYDTNSSGGHRMDTCNSCVCACRRYKKLYYQRNGGRRGERTAPPSTSTMKTRPWTKGPKRTRTEPTRAVTRTRVRTQRTTTMKQTRTTPTVTKPRGGGRYPTSTGDCRKCAVDNFNELNAYRARNGLVTLKWNNELIQLATVHSKVQFDDRDMKHSDVKLWENVAYRYVSRSKCSQQNPYSRLRYFLCETSFMWNWKY